MGVIESFYLLSLCIYHEARGEPFKGMVAVGHVVLNRVEKREKSVRGVIFEPMQFSWANDGERPPVKDHQSMMTCMSAVWATLNERLQGSRMNGVDHYYSVDIPEPYWAKDMEFMFQIGKHRFYKS